MSYGLYCIMSYLTVIRSHDRKVAINYYYYYYCGLFLFIECLQTPVAMFVIFVDW